MAKTQYQNSNNCTTTELSELLTQNCVSDTAVLSKQRQTEKVDQRPLNENNFAHIYLNGEFSNLLG